MFPYFLPDLEVLGDYSGSLFLSSDPDILFNSSEQDDIGKFSLFTILLFILFYKQGDIVKTCTPSFNKRHNLQIFEICYSFVTGMELGFIHRQAS